MDKFEQHIKRMKGLRDVYEVGTGQHNILSMLINECEASLRQPPVSGAERKVCPKCSDFGTIDNLDGTISTCPCHY